MKLGNVLRAAGTAQPINPRDVDVWVVGRDAQLHQVKAHVKAKLVYVDEDQRAALRVAATTYLSKQYDGKTIPTEVAEDEMDLRQLFEALKDEDTNADGQYQRFADTIDELRAALTKQECARLIGEFRQYMQEEFPSNISAADFVEMVDDAKKGSALDLLTKYGYANAVRALSSLAGLSPA